MNSVTHSDQQQLALMIKKLSAAYQNNRDMINIGMYQAGADPMVDVALKHWTDIQGFLTQGMHEKADMQLSLQQLHDLIVKMQAS